MVVKKKKARDHKRRSSNNGSGGYGKSADKWVSPVITYMLSPEIQTPCVEGRSMQYCI